MEAHIPYILRIVLFVCLIGSSLSCKLGIGERICRSSADCLSGHHCEAFNDGVLRCILDSPPNPDVSSSSGDPGPADTPASQAATFYCTDVQPILERACLSCHDERNRSGQDFRLDYYETRLGVRGARAMAGRIKVRVVELRNMPRSIFPQPTDLERAVLARWVNDGAPYCDESPAPRDTGTDEPNLDAGTPSDAGAPNDGGMNATDGGTPVDGGTSVDGGTPVSFADDVQPIFDRRCNGCHDSIDRSGNLDLEDNAYANLVNVPSRCDGTALRVVPGDPENSMLWRKLAAAPDRCGGVMPLGGPGLRVTAPADFDVIESWIRQGALNN